MAITSLLGDVAMTIKGKMPGQVNIDSKVFQLHYRLTTFLFLACLTSMAKVRQDVTVVFVYVYRWQGDHSAQPGPKECFSILSTATSLIGNPINCFCTDCANKGISKEVMDTHCWISGTYTLPNKNPVVTRRIGFEMYYHGLGTQQRDEERKYHLYYQWVPFVLFLQGVLFYMPHWMWEINEDGRVHALVHDMRLPTMDKEALKKRIGNLTVYVNETLGSYDGYYLRFVLCDFLNIINVFGNMFLINRFINNEFMSYGPRCVQYFSNSSSVSVSPLTVTFPKLTKCEFQAFGVSGTVQNLDAICVLALNILNEKVYLFLWFWLVILSIITVVIFVFRTPLMFVKRFRVPLFQRRAHTMKTADIKDVVKNIKIGDFFFLSLLAKNLDITAFRMFLAQLARVVRKQKGLRHTPGNVQRGTSQADREADALVPKTPQPGGQSASTMDIMASHLGSV